MTASTRQNRPYLIGMAGGSGSGKTFFARALQAALGDEICGIVCQDNFYFDQSGRFDHDGGLVNFDHPDALDFGLLASCLSALREGRHVEIPTYDFVTHTRSPQGFLVRPRPVLLVDGILILHSEKVRGLFDESIFFDAPEDLRFRRRLERDTRERGRTEEGVQRQFFSQVKPMHDRFVQPSHVHAGTIVRDGGDTTALVEEFACRLGKR